MNKFVAIVAAGIAAGAPHAASAMPMYDIRDLGILTGTASYVTAINRAGNVVGASLASGTGTGFYTSGTTLRSFGTLGGASAFPNAINGSDGIVGDSLTANGEDHAFYSLRGGALQDLGTLGGTSSSANGINTSRQIVGWAALPGDQTSHAFITTPGGAMQDLGLLNPGDGYSVANAINDQGVVIGYSGDNGFVWTIRNGMQAYGPPNMIVNMTGLNNTGQLVGTMLTDSTTGSAEHAFAGTLAGAITDLGTLGGPAYSAAFGINDRGIIVGESYASSNQVGTTAFVDDGTTMYDLNAMIPSIPDLYLRSASGINSNGQIVVNGTIGGIDHAFLLTPNAMTYVANGIVIADPDYVGPTSGPIPAAVPEPASLTLLALGLLGVGPHPPPLLIGPALVQASGCIAVTLPGGTPVDPPSRIRKPSLSPYMRSVQEDGPWVSDRVSSMIWPGWPGGRFRLWRGCARRWRAPSGRGWTRRSGGWTS